MKQKKEFAKIYLEITNLCNMRCDFCRGTVRAAAFVAPEEFAARARKVSGFTDHVYLHVMGEPLLHPRLGELIDIAADEGLKVSITTNGTLLGERIGELVSRAKKLYKVSISLHSFEANSDGKDASEYFDTCFACAKALGEAGVIAALRLWNLEGSSRVAPKNSENGEILSRMKEFFGGEWTKNRSGEKIGEGVYLEWGEKFDWPDMSAPEGGEHGFCYAMKDHVAVLCDGSVVPCCLDADGKITLGNLDKSELFEILQTPAARAVREGFAAHRLAHPLCRRCGFAKRW